MNDFPRRPLRIGTRTSPMALAQTEQVKGLLQALEPDLAVEAVPIQTEADLWQGDLAEIGGKGLFVKAIDLRLQRGEIDLAIHCLKDVPGDLPLPEGLVFAAMPPRDDVLDVLVTPRDATVKHLGELPPGARIGSSAVRRKAQINRVRPDLDVVAVRGTVGTRIDKLDGVKPHDTPLDAMILARSGLERLGLRHRARQVFTADEMLPAVGAGVLALECRGDDAPVTALLRRLNDATTWTEATAERVMLRDLRGHCNSPIAGYCVTGPDGRLTLRGMVFSPDGSTLVHAHLSADPGADPATLGARAAAELLRQGAADIIAGIPH